MTTRSELLDADLRHLEELWQGPLGDAYQHYRVVAGPRLALAAALVETGISLHGLGSHVASPGHLLLGDLCLARSSRLLAEEAGRTLQVRFARAIEQAAALAASGRSDLPLRALLNTALKEDDFPPTPALPREGGGSLEEDDFPPTPALPREGGGSCEEGS